MQIILAFDVRGQLDVLIIRNSMCFFFNILLLLVCLMTLLVRSTAARLLRSWV